MLARFSRVSQRVAGVRRVHSAADTSRFFKYRSALTRALPHSFVAALCEHAPTDPINLDRAHRQHEQYVHVLKQLGLKVAELPAEESMPDCCFVEDTAVAIGDRALITRIGHPSRAPESASVASQLKKMGLSLLDEMHSAGSQATLDGGDVMFTGRDIIVGASSRSNAGGAEQLRKCFDMPVVSIPVAQGLHLKSAVSFAGERTVLVAASHPVGRDVQRLIERARPGVYEFLGVPDSAAANVLFINGCVVMRAREEYPESAAVIAQWARAHRYETAEINMSEFAKADGALTCCSILLAV